MQPSVPQTGIIMHSNTTLLCKSGALLCNRYCFAVSGMSTAPEVIVARQCGMLCFSLALVTNACVMIDDDTSREDAALVSSSSDAVVTGAEAGPSHEEVLDSGLRHAQNIELFFRGLISEIATMLRTKTE